MSQKRYRKWARDFYMNFLAAEVRWEMGQIINFRESSSLEKLQGFQVKKKKHEGNSFCDLDKGK